MKKKKQNTDTDPKIMLARHRKLFMERLKEICDVLAGPGIFEKLPSQALTFLFETRYPVLKVKVAPGSAIPKEKVEAFNKHFLKEMEEVYINTDTDKKLLLSWYLTDGLLLIHFAETLVENHFPGSALIKEAFKSYFTNTKGYQVGPRMLAAVLQDIEIFHSSLNDRLLIADMAATACQDMNTLQNVIYLRDFKPEKTQITIEGKKRDLTRVGWIGKDFEFMWAKIKPSKLGFDVAQFDIPLDVYIQNHAFLRLQERLGITPGIMHMIAFLTFHEFEIEYYKRPNHTLIAVYLSDEKAGYFLVTMNDAKIIIRSFLFLTNDGTPEGKKLEEMTDMQLLDKKFLGIDNLSTFNSLNINADEKLTKLFIAAGCGSLLKLSHLKAFSQDKLEDKDAASLHQYLSASE
ncbi:hypothetical protein, partial [Arcticibacter svalbardensis]|uniref:hypothetical protein n=1 Tax=Arcticibacter svalbardensis TaxID=1288027 RepID=UPI00059087D6